MRALLLTVVLGIDAIVPAHAQPAPQPLSSLRTLDVTAAVTLTVEVAPVAR